MFVLVPSCGRSFEFRLWLDRKKFLSFQLGYALLSLRQSRFFYCMKPLMNCLTWLEFELKDLFYLNMTLVRLVSKFLCCWMCYLWWDKLVNCGLNLIGGFWLCWLLLRPSWKFGVTLLWVWISGRRVRFIVLEVPSIALLCLV